ncbi:acyl-CoA thioesterase [Nocardia transvalensis]|uniref:acyl-CoA thioesterase n=1 Tax=Nocardia transvalensis TaxID=37333 RepID=UPI001895F7A6|nr:acyl-CoA thioesterase domain-containing protein [Nocardia transvalensis]MBF6332830.1 thioesterase family protein [Nocardia transvalensis]
MVALLDAIAVEQVGTNIFRGRPRTDTVLARTFGGEVAARALAAGSAGKPPEFHVNSIHGYFVRPTVPGVPIDYQVDTVKHGRSFLVRWIRALQDGDEKFLMVASFHCGDQGVRHADPMPAAPSPDELVTVGSADPGNEWPGWDIRRVPDAEVGGGARQQIWLRYTEDLPGDMVTSTCALTYASDMTLLGAAMAPYPGLPIQTAALDYSIWFMRPFRVDDWLLYDEVSPSADGGRAFTQGRIFSRDGQLVAMVAQERMLRVVGAEFGQNSALIGKVAS